MLRSLSRILFICAEKHEKHSQTLTVETSPRLRGSARAAALKLLAKLWLFAARRWGRGHPLSLDHLVERAPDVCHLSRECANVSVLLAEGQDVV